MQSDGQKEAQPKSVLKPPLQHTVLRIIRRYFCSCLFRLRSVLSSNPAWAVCSPYQWETYLKIAQVVKQRKYSCDTWCFCRAAHLLKSSSSMTWMERAVCVHFKQLMVLTLRTFPYEFFFSHNGLGFYTFFSQDFRWQASVTPICCCCFSLELKWFPKRTQGILELWLQQFCCVWFIMDKS